MEKKEGAYGGDPRALADAARMLCQENRRGIVLTGRIRNGKVELDQAAVDEISRQFPNAEMSFVAVNAPFDPKSRTISGDLE